MVMRWKFFALLALVLAGGLPACGGGGGGSTDEGCTAPGVIRALAIAGQAAPGTAGNFSVFPIDPAMAVAPGGWAVFVADTSDAAMGQVLYVALPDGTVLPAFARGETVPDAAGGTIDEILAARVNGGRLLAYVTITGDGGGRTRGLLSALVAGGTVTEKNDVVYSGAAAPDLTGTFAAFVPDSLYLVGTTFVLFGGTTTTAQEGLFRVAVDGTSLTRLVGTGSAVTGGTIDTIEAFGVDVNAAWYAFVTERTDNSLAVYVSQIGASGFAELIEEGDTLGGGTVMDLPSGQPLAVDALGRVLFRAVNSMGLDYLMVGAAGYPPEVIVEEGQEDAQWSGGDLEDPRWIRNYPGVVAPMMQADVSANANGIVFAVYGVTSLTEDPTLALYNGRPAPEDLGTTERFSSIFPGLGGAGRFDVAGVGELAFANVLNSGRGGVFWLRPGCGLFTLAVGGATAPGGDTYAGTDLWRVTTAADVVLFRAPLVGAGSGIFRRGP